MYDTSQASHRLARRAQGFSAAAITPACAPPGEMVASSSRGLGQLGRLAAGALAVVVHAQAPWLASSGGGALGKGPDAGWPDLLPAAAPA